MRPRPHAALALVAALVAAACGDPTGSVELAWVFVDRDGDPIFPGGVFSVDDERDTCGLPGVTGTQSVSYDLRAELEICDPECEAGCDADECLVLERHRFGCRSARGNEPEVPASDSSYRFTVRAIISAPSVLEEVCDQALPTCLAAPAARERTVEAGRVVDLQVYQIAVDIDRSAARAVDRQLDLKACGCA
jgi:hypothetical protein